MSKQDVLLTAAAKLSQPFGRTDLVVAAWEESPEMFGLPGRLDLPDSHRAMTTLYARYGPIASGFVTKRGAEMLVTERGREAANLLLRAKLDFDAGKHYPAQPLDTGKPRQSTGSRELQRMGSSLAHSAFERGRRDLIDEHLAEDFWGVQLSAGLKEVEDRARRTLNGREQPEERVVGACHDWLVERFRRQLTRKKVEKGG